MNLEPIAYLTRRETFSACHRLHSVHLTNAKNVEIFGKCNNENGHGHNYVVEITVRGPINKLTGMIVNVRDLNAIIKKAVLEPLDHKNIDKDVPYFFNNNVISTTENLAVFIWNNVYDYLKACTDNIDLHKVRIKETDKNFITYKGE